MSQKDWTAEPLTDEDLTELWEYAQSGPPEPADCYQIGRAVREIRRLRSDEWLKRAAEEIVAEPTTRFDDTHTAAILRKHRDAL